MIETGVQLEDHVLLRGVGPCGHEAHKGEHGDGRVVHLDIVSGRLRRDKDVVNGQSERLVPARLRQFGVARRQEFKAERRGKLFGLRMLDAAPIRSRLHP